MSDAKWKAANYDKNITVSQAAIDDLKSRGTKEANIAYYKQHGATTEQREAMNRFYGKGTVGSSVLPSADSANVRESRAQEPSPLRPNAREDRGGLISAPSPSNFIAGNANARENRIVGNTPAIAPAITPLVTTNAPGLMNSSVPQNRAANPARVPSLFTGVKNVLGNASGTPAGKLVGSTVGKTPLGQVLALPFKK